MTAPSREVLQQTIMWLLASLGKYTTDNEKLLELVKEAYHEGAQDGAINVSADPGSMGYPRAWSNSKTKAALDAFSSKEAN